MKIIAGDISKVVIRRLPRYLRVLETLLNKDVERVSSKELAQKLGSTASQVRQDFNCFGDFGQHGYGYKVIELYNKISNILYLNKTYYCIVIGAGNIGQAIINYHKFSEIGFNITGVFDINPKIIGTYFNGIEVLDIDRLDEYVENNNIDIAILSLPDDQTSLIYSIIKNRVKGVWNFATIDLFGTDKTSVENINLNDSLFTLVYFLNRN